MLKVLNPLYLCNQNFYYFLMSLRVILQTFYDESVYEFVNFLIDLVELFNLHHYLLFNFSTLSWKFDLNWMSIELKVHSSSFLNDLFSSLPRQVIHLVLIHLRFLFILFDNTIFIDMLIENYCYLNFFSFFIAKATFFLFIE